MKIALRAIWWPQNGYTRVLIGLVKAVLVGWLTGVGIAIYILTVMAISGDKVSTTQPFAGLVSGICAIWLLFFFHRPRPYEWRWTIDRKGDGRGPAEAPIEEMRAPAQGNDQHPKHPMQRRERIAWILAAVFLCAAMIGFSDFESSPDWVLINTQYGAVRMDRRTGRTQRLVNSSWREVSQYYTQ